MTRLVGSIYQEYTQKTADGLMADPSVRRDLVNLVAQQRIAEKDISHAVELAEIYPDGNQWNGFINRLLIWLGALGLGFGMIFFIAANWQLMGPFAKFALVEGLLLAFVTTYWCYCSRPLIAKASLVVAMLSVGALMALFGQTYQTGADPWQLFFNWAMVTLPWVLISRYVVMWLIWLLLLNTACALYFQLWGAYHEVAQAGFLLNSLALGLWQWASKGYKWLDNGWAINLVAACSSYFAMWFFLDSLFDESFIGLILWLVWAAAIFYLFRYAHLNLFILSIWCLCLIFAINSLLVKLMDNEFVSLSFFLLSVITIGAGAYSAIWLKGLVNGERK